MTEEIKAAISDLLKKATATGTPAAALNYTQAALNLAHTAQVMAQVAVTERS